MADIYDLDAVYADIAGEPFPFRWAGQEWVLPHFADMDWRAAGLAADFERAADADGVAEIDVTVLQRLFTFAFGPDQAARWDKVPQNLPAMVKLFQQWQTSGGTTVGESSASAGSSASTGRPSRRTSTGTTASGSRRRSTGLPKSA